MSVFKIVKKSIEKSGFYPIIPTPNVPSPCPSDPNPY